MQAILEKVTRFIEENRQNILDDLFSLCRIDSVAHNNEDGFPYGKGVDDALCMAQKLCDEHGIDCKVRHDLGYATSKVTGGEKTIGFFSHCDVVPANAKEWTKTQPFTPLFDGAHLYCRGSEDNKAAAIGGIYISEMIKKGILPVKSSFLCYFGGNEECGMGDLKSFIKNEKLPDLSLVPDNGYPVCVGEKGIARFSAKSKKSFRTVTKFDGGTVVNAVIGTLEAEIGYTKELFDELSEKIDNKFSLSQKDGKICLCAFGKSTHAANPKSGENAAIMAAQLLCSCKNFDENDKELLSALLSLCDDYYGAGAGITAEDENFGKNTFVLGISRCKDEKGCFEFDSRFGRGISTEMILDNIRIAFEKAGFEYSVKEVKDCYVTNTDEKYVEALMRTYAKMCGVQRETLSPHYSAGGTYARLLNSPCGSLGLSIHNFAGLDVPNKDLPSGHGEAHQADECIFFDAFLKGIVTDAMIIYELDKLM